MSAAAPGPTAGTVVVKIGTSSLTDEPGHTGAVAKLSAEVAEVRGLRAPCGAGDQRGHRRGLGAPWPRPRPSDPAVLQAASAVGQSRLLATYDEAFARHGLVAGQVLLSPYDFFDRRQYLHARRTLGVLLELGVVPIVNENDAVADDEIRFGDNDRLAALVAHLVHAETLLLLTDAPGLLTGDPRVDAQATLIAEIVEVDHDLESLAGGAGSARGSGGMASKLAAAKIAAWSGVRAVIAAASRPGVVLDALNEVPGVGTVVVPRSHRLGARKLWIAFALPAEGRIRVDAGAEAAVDRARGVAPACRGARHPRGVLGRRRRGDRRPGGTRSSPRAWWASRRRWLDRWAGRHSDELPDDVASEVVHRDDMVVLE